MTGRLIEKASTVRTPEQTSSSANSRCEHHCCSVEALSNPLQRWVEKNEKGFGTLPQCDVTAIGAVPEIVNVTVCHITVGREPTDRGFCDRNVI
jgi:hypothetical protein